MLKKLRQKYPINLNPKVGQGVELASDHQIIFVMTDSEMIDNMEVPLKSKDEINIYFLKR